MTGHTIVKILYLSVSLIWLATKGRSLIERNDGYLIPIIVFGIGSGMMVLGTNHTNGWAGTGAVSDGLLVTGASLILFLIVFIFEEIKRRKG
ncbi:hypothetical protein FZC78_16050 [Rossellomorea vietnamensis]|uniref:Uncharacterized protein n=1 Tax=Rossellomorea vietnamensis TaxID=218284 RepID=A0A5D4NPB8_9BACI|nr:hypothetical protein [Rossellomorea vietnamensis]TYS15166.1 hypothetical protein FZC78_16050 [Rossellomorea vietnamensis]